MKNLEIKIIFQDKEKKFNGIWILIMLIFLSLSVAHIILASISINVEALQAIRIGKTPLNQELIDYAKKQNTISMIVNFVTAAGYFIAAITAFLSSEILSSDSLQGKNNSKWRWFLVAAILILLVVSLVALSMFVRNVNKREYPVPLDFNLAILNSRLMEGRSLCFTLPDGQEGIIEDVSKVNKDNIIFGKCLNDLSNCDLLIDEKGDKNCDSKCIYNQSHNSLDCKGISSSNVTFKAGSFSGNVCFNIPTGKIGFLKTAFAGEMYTVAECLDDYSKCVLDIPERQPLDFCLNKCEIKEGEKNGSCNNSLYPSIFDGRRINTHLME